MDGDADGYGNQIDDYDDEDADLMDMEGEIDVIEEEEDAENGGGDNFKNKRGYTKNRDRITSSFLTKYERARILGTRAL